MSAGPVYYFDNNATTRVAPEAVEAMLPFLTERWGNPSSAYGFGHAVAREVDRARERVAALIGAEPKEVVFTSGGTESIHAALQSACLADPARRHVVTTAVEHSATLKFCEVLRRRGCEVTHVPVDAGGGLDLHRFEQALRPDTVLASVMWANNETGVMLPVAEAAALCRSRGVLFHTDAVQAAGKVRIDVHEVGADFLSLSAHKLHAPKGIGALFIRAGTKFQPYFVGGHQERGRRAGTENVPSMVAFGRAAELALSHLDEVQGRVRALRDHLETTLLSVIPRTALNGAKEPRLPNTSNLAFELVEAEALLLLLDQAGICASSGSACTTGSLEPSHVLTAMGISPERARGSVRFSLSVYTTRAEVDLLLAALPEMVSRLRFLSPMSTSAL